MQTTEAQQELNILSTLLKASLKADDSINWGKLKDRSPFPEIKPSKPELLSEPKLGSLPPEPQRTEWKYQQYIPTLLDNFTSRKQQYLQDKERFLQEKETLFAAEYKNWETNVSNLRSEHSRALQSHEREISKLKQFFDKETADWEERRAAYRRLIMNNTSLDAKRAAYEAHDASVIEEYCNLVLSRSRYPVYFPQEFDIEYDSTTKLLIVDYQLPGPDELPKLKAVKYVASRNEFEKQFITDAQAAKQYDDVLYQIILRTIHELFEADAILALGTIVVNGIVTAVDRTTGKPVTACILSLRADRFEFMSINLSQVDTRACFKSLKGVGSSKLHSISPVPPIMPLPREDRRFISSYAVANTLDASVNLAAIDWEDFEHLIREVFKKEFSSTGGEVRVTQASRDGGVDAVAFDPDPIRGGKIVIQAKRYTNTVGVGAVRELYGTVVNEGATKGILVTTSDYGSDSYAFANGKPLVLINGSNLLHMLEKHGYQARIDLQEAKKLAK